MGWTASYQLLRQTPLSTEEITALAQLNQEAHAEPWEGECFSIAVAQAARSAKRTSRWRAIRSSEVTARSKAPYESSFSTSDTACYAA